MDPITIALEYSRDAFLPHHWVRIIHQANPSRFTLASPGVAGNRALTATNFAAARVETVAWLRDTHGAVRTTVWQDRDGEEARAVFVFPTTVEE